MKIIKKSLKFKTSFIAVAFLLVISYRNADAEVSYPIYTAPDRSVTALTDASGTIVKKYGYDAFGNITSSVGSVGNNYTYVGEAKDNETGLIFLRHRYFDSVIGRFVSKDPLLGQKNAPQTLSPYVYCANNPVTWLDPLGLATLYYWQGSGDSKKRQGWCSHVAIMLNDGTYISNWPAQTRSQVGVFFSSPSGDRTFKMDNDAESGNLLHTLQINDLNEQAMATWWKGSTKNFSIWYDCAATVAMALRKGGINMPNHFIYMPEAVWRDINKKINNSSTTGSRSRRIKDRKRDDSHIGPPWNDGGGGSGGATTNGGSYYNNYNPYRYGIYGGVSLSKTADLMLNIQDVDGATYDEATGQVILYGKHDVSLPNMEMDDLAVAIRSVYGLNKPAQDPGVSIGTETSDVQGQMKVRYDGETLNTKFGDIMFESDRLLKCLTMGKDNVTGGSISSGVSGYANLLERYKAAGSGSMPSAGTLYRMWFTPKEVKLIQSEDGSSMVFDTATMQVLTESMFKNNTFGDLVCEAFASHFTQNYDAFSSEFSELKELKRLGKIAAVVKWIKDNNIPFDLSFFENFAPQFYSTPQYTPQTTVSTSWTEGNTLWSLEIIGGVMYNLDVSNFSTSTDPLADAASQAAINARPGDENFMWEFNGQDASGQNQQYTAIAQSLTRAKKDGNVNIVEVDMTLPVLGDNPVSLVRYYDSFYDKSAGFGQGWQITPYALRFPDDKRTFTFGSGALSVSAHYQIFIRQGSAEYLYTLSGLDANGKPVYMWEGGSDFLKDGLDGTFLLNRKNNGIVLFNSYGQVTQVFDRNGIYILYTYGGSKLISIGGGGKHVELNYDGDKITSVTGPWGKIVNYTYYPNGQLETATDQENQTTTYYYDTDNRLIKIDNPKGNHAYQAVYDDYNRASTETIGSAQYSSQYSLSDRQTVITDPNGTQTTMFFDTDYKLLQGEDYLNNKVNYTYTGQNFGPSTVTDPEGKVTEYKYDSQGNVCYVKNPQGHESFFFYDSNNNMVASRDELGRDATYLYDDNNRLVEIHHVAIIDYDPASGPPQNAGSYNQTYDPAYVTHFTYDPSNGNLLSATDAEGQAVNITYNAHGLPLIVTTPSGYQVTTTYDNLGRATSITNQGGENASFEYDNVDRVKKITTVAGSVNYTYDNNGNISTLYDGKNNPTSFGYDNDDNLVTVTDAEGGLTSYEYDVMGNITKITMPNGSTQEITYDESGRPISEINRRANPAPQAVALVSSLDFGSISSGTSAEKDIVVYNVGDADLSVTSVSVSGSDFTVNPSSAVVLPHGQVALAVTYTAPAVGASTGNLTINSNDAGHPAITVTLSGNSVQQSLNTRTSSTLNGMFITWDKYTGTGLFDHYAIYRSDNAITDISGLTSIETIADINQTSYLDSTVTLQNQYYYSVVAFDSSSNSLTPVTSTKPVTYLNLGKIGDLVSIASSSNIERNVAVVYNNPSREYLLLYEYDVSGTGANYDIYGQRLAEDGTKTGSAFPVFNSSRTERNVQVAWNSTRNEYMAVCEYDSDGSGNYKLRMQRFSSTGSLLGSVIDNYITSNGQSNPCISYNSVDNRYLIGFDNDYYGNGKEVLLFVLLDADGTTLYVTGWGISGIRLKRGKLAYNPSANDYLCVFEYITGTNTYVTGNKLSSIGDTLSNTFVIGAYLNNDTLPNVIYDSSRGGYVVIWQFDYSGSPGQNWNIVRKVSADGVPGDWQPYSVTGGSMLWPSIAVFGSRNEYLMAPTILNVTTNEYNIVAQRISSVDLSILTNSAINVASWTPLIERKASSVFDPNNNEFLIAYERQLGSDCDVAAQRVGELTTLLDIEPASLDFGSDLAEQTIQVSDVSGQSSMSLINSTDNAWLSVSPATVDIEDANPTATLTVSINRSGLSAGSYSGYVDVSCAGIGTYVPVTMVVNNTSPNSPANPTPQPDTTGQAVLGAPLRVVLAWQCSDPEGDALTYNIYLSDNQSLVASADPSVLVAQDQAGVSFVSPAIGYNKTYYWRVKAKDSGGLTTLGDVWSFNTSSLSAPILIPCSPNPTNSAKPVFRWNAVDGAALYHVQIADNPNFNSPIINATDVAATEYTPSMDLPEGTIYWRVAAIDSQGGEGDFSSTGSNSIIIDVTPPPQVNLVTYTPDPTNNQKPTLTWNASVGASLYHVQIASTSDFSSLLFNGHVSGINYTPVSNFPEGPIWWRVSAKDLAGNESPYSNSGAFTIDITPPESITIASADEQFAQIIINWNTFGDIHADFNHFNIYRSEALITNVTGMTSINQAITNKSVITFVDTTVVAGKAYYYAVTATDNAGNEYKQVTSFGPVNFNVYKVGGADPDFNTIQAALNGVPSNSVIYVRPGTYEESLVVLQNKNGIKLIGDSAYTVTIKGNLVFMDDGIEINGVTIKYGSGVYVNYTNTYYSGLQVSSDAGITAIDSDIVVENCIIEPNPDIFAVKFGKAIQIWNMYGSSNRTPTIENNLILNADIGASLFSQTFGGTISGEIKNNTFVANNVGILLRMHNEDPIIKDNIIINSLVSGVELTYKSGQLLNSRILNITGNNLFNNAHNVWCDEIAKELTPLPDQTSEQQGNLYIDPELDADYLPQNPDSMDKGYSPLL